MFKMIVSTQTVSHTQRRNLQPNELIDETIKGSILRPKALH